MAVICRVVKGECPNGHLTIYAEGQKAGFVQCAECKETFVLSINCPTTEIIACECPDDKEVTLLQDFAYMPDTFTCQKCGKEFPVKGVKKQEVTPEALQTPAKEGGFFDGIWGFLGAVGAGMLANNVIRALTKSGPHCPECGASRTFADEVVMGTCPHCNHNYRA
jgi:uncharacterized Zn-finger protein